jgi:hypothetical protein
MPQDKDQSANVTDAKALRAVERAVRSADKAMKQLNRTTVQLEKKLKRLRSAYMQFDKTVKRSVQSQTKAIAVQKKMVVGLRQTTRSLKKQNKELRQTTKESKAAAKATGGLLSSLRSLGSLVGIGGLGFLAVNRIKQTIDKRFNLALTGGAGQLTALRSLTGGRNLTAALDLSARFQAQSDFARFGIGGQGNRGLVAAQRALERVGLDRANEIILAVTKGLEPDRLKQFLTDAEGGNIRRALLNAASGQNIGAVSTALNALDISKGAESGKLDPMLQAATEFAEVGNRLADSFDQVADTVVKDLLPHISKLTDTAADLAAKLGGLSTTDVALGAAALLLGPSILKGGGKLALKGLGKGATRLLPRLLPAGGAGAAGAGGAASVPAAALAIPAALAVGGGLAGDKINRDTIRYMQEAERANGDNALAELARHNKDNAKNRRELLVAKRQRLSFMASQTSSPVVDEDSSFLDRTLRAVGLVPDLPDQSKQLAQIQAQLAAVNAEIAAIDQGTAKNAPIAAKDAKSRPVVKLMEWIKRGANTAKRGVDALGKSLKELEQKALEANLKKLQQQAAKRQQLELTASEQASLTQLARIEFQIAQTSPFGVAASRAGMESLLGRIADEIAALEDYLANIDQSTAQGRIEANKTRGEIAQLRLERKQINRQFLDALKGLAISEALGASGAFKKIILDQNNALAIALEKGIFRDDLPEVTGSIGPSKGLKPRSIKDIIAGNGTGKSVVHQSGGAASKDDAAEQASELAKNARKNAEMMQRLAELLGAMEEPTPPEMMRPTRSGGRTSLGTR